MLANTESFLFIIEMGYLLAACGFFVSLKLLGSPKYARLGNALGALAMGLALLLTFLLAKPNNLSPIIGAIILGSLAGAYFSYRVAMTQMPQLVALFNGLGGLASVLVALSEAFHTSLVSPSTFMLLSSWLSIVVGAITLSGSLLAYIKLQELITSRPVLFPGLSLVTSILCLASCFIFILMLDDYNNISYLIYLFVIASILGVLLVLPIGGADMPVVISLLNSYSGLAALFAGFVVKSNLLIIAGALVGASGIILTRLMCQAMNRSLFNVVFGAFSSVSKLKNQEEAKPSKEFLPLDAALLLANAAKVIMVPGYGLAVSQAQRNLREIADALKARGIELIYAVHPVAGRMPGHMNVLLAEADVPYQELFDIDEVNSEFESSDVVLVVGANDVVNPSARSDKNSPLFGMPILNADKSKSIIILKRGRGTGFAGVDNPLFSLDNAGIVYGDAKQSLVKILNSLKDV